MSGEMQETRPPPVPEPEDAAQRRAAKPVVCYKVDRLPKCDMASYLRARERLAKLATVRVLPREARTFEIPAGHFFRIVSVEGPQVGDLNLWNRDNMKERFYTSKTRQLHATHVSTGDRLWSTMPWMRPMATITHDTLAWYGWDADGAGIHDVIGSRCDPYTQHRLTGQHYDHCCHSNLTRSLVELGVSDAEDHVHDVLNVFMCTGFTNDTKQYFMKASPVRPGDFIEFFAEINLLGSLSTCPGGDCSATHSDDATPGYPLLVEIYKPAAGTLQGWQPPSPSGYAGGHGLSAAQRKRKLDEPA